jgi:hypothetical protein
VVWCGWLKVCLSKKRSGDLGLASEVKRGCFVDEETGPMLSFYGLQETLMGLRSCY